MPAALSHHYSLQMLFASCQKDKCERCLLIQHENPAGGPVLEADAGLSQSEDHGLVAELPAGNELHRFIPTSKLQHQLGG